MLISNSFSHEQFSGNTNIPIALSGFGATLQDTGVLPVAMSGNYYDADLIGTQLCSVFGFATCTDITSNPNYFYNNSVNPPLDMWDFATVWETTSTLPVFRQSVISTPTVISQARLTRTDTGLNLPFTESPPDSAPPASSPLVSASISPTSGGSSSTGAQSGPVAPDPPKGLVDRVVDSIKNFLNRLPETTVRSFPYVLFGLVLLVAGIMLIEITRQARHLRRLQVLIAQQRSVAQQRDTFWHLAANYLRAPVTLLAGGAELLRLKKVRAISAAKASAINTHVLSLQAKVSSIMEAIETDDTLKGIEWPKSQPKSNLLTSPGFWLPIMALVLLVGLANYIVAGFRGLEVSTISYLTQAVVFILVIYFWYWVLSHLRGVRHKVLAAEAVAEKQSEALKGARANLVDQSVGLLSNDIHQLQAEISTLPATHEAAHSLQEGTNRLARLLSSFRLLSAAQAGKLDQLSPAGASSDLGKVVNKAVSEDLDTARQKSVVVETPRITGMSVAGGAVLTEQVVESVLGNAIEYSPAKSTVKIESLEKPGMQGLAIHDAGSGVSHEQFTHMFEPFTKADGSDALRLNHEGLGVNLYLDKLIMEHLGGEIAAESSPETGTTISMWWPKATT